MKICAVIEARMTSTRLPGKVLMKSCNQPMLHYMIYRLRYVKKIDEIIIATTINKEDDEIVEFCKKEGVSFYRGSENNVFSRVIEAIDSIYSDIVVHLTGDCPLLDHRIVDQYVNIYLANNIDYIGNANIRSYPDGMDVQVTNINVLKKSYKLTDNLLDREHVTLHIRNNPNLFSYLNIIAPKDLYWPELGVTLDEKSDYYLIDKILNAFNNNKLFSCYELIRLLKNNSEWLNINKNVLRKGAT